MTCLKRFGLLCLILILLVPAAALASSAGTVYLIIGDAEITDNTTTSDYTFTFTKTEYPRAGTLVVKDGAKLPAIRFNTMELTIEVKGTSEIKSIDTGIAGQTHHPFPVSIKGGGTLNMPSGYISAENGLGVYDGTTVNVTNPAGSAIFVQKGQLSVYGGAKLNAVTQSAEADAVTCQDVYRIVVSGEGSTLKARGGKIGIRNYRWATSGVTGSVYVEGGGYLEASGSGHSLYNRYWGDDDNKTGSLEVDEKSSVKLNGKIITVLDLPPSYDYKTSEGASVSLAPYDGTAPTGDYLEIKGHTVFVPVLSRSPETDTITLGDAQTYSISGSNSVSAPAGTVYEWSVDGEAQSASGSSFTFSGDTVGAHTVACKVTLRIDGVSHSITHQRKVTVQAIDASGASVIGLEYSWRDNLTPAVIINGKPLRPGTDYTMQMEYMGSMVEIAYGAMLNQTPGEVPITFTFKGDYRGSVTGKVKIKPVSLSATTVKLSFDSTPYNGLHQKPEVVSITYKDYTFKEEGFIIGPKGDYYIPMDLRQAIQPGNYSIAIESRAPYLTGTYNATYTITKATPDVNVDPLSFSYGDTFSGPSSLQWNAPGNDSAIALTEGTDYTYTSPAGRLSDIGTHTGTITFAGNLLTGTDSFIYSVNPKQITEDNVSLSNADLVFNGADRQPDVDVNVKVRLGDDAADTTLDPGTDYTVTITRDGQPVEEMKDPGTYTFVVSGLNNYTGTVSCACRVDRLPLAEGDATLTSDKLAWTGSSCVPGITVQKELAGSVMTDLSDGTDYEVQWLKGSDAATALPVTEEQLTDPGDYFALITGIGNYRSSIAVPFSIVPANTADGGADTYLEDTAQDEFVFGQSITVRINPESDGTIATFAARLMRSLTQPASGDDTMTLYLGSVQLTQPASPDENGVYTASVNTTHSAVADAVTQLPATFTLTASFSGNGRLAGRTYDLPVTITPATLTVPQAEGVDRFCREGDRTVSISSVTLSGMLAPYDDVQADIAALEAEVDSDQAGVYTKAYFDLSEPIALKGAHSGYYQAPEMKFIAETNVTLFGPPVITTPTEAVEQKVYDNNSTVLSVTAEGEELSFRWYKLENGVETLLNDGAEYTGATSPELHIACVQPGSATQYVCRVSNDAGSDEAEFTVIAVSLPQTGDGSVPTLWMLLLAASLIGVCILRRRNAKA